MTQTQPAKGVGVGLITSRHGGACLAYVCPGPSSSTCGASRPYVCLNQSMSFASAALRSSFVSWKRASAGSRDVTVRHCEMLEMPWFTEDVDQAGR